MKLSQLAAKPQLIQMSIDDEAMVEKYGEAVDFWMYDRYDMDVYLNLLNTEEKDVKKLTDIVKDLLLDENGKQLLEQGEILPTDILMKVVEKVVGQLGNSAAQTSIT